MTAPRVVDPSPAQQALGVRVIARPNPFSTARHDGLAEAGLTVEQIVAGAIADPAFWPFAHVTIADAALTGEPVPVPRAQWSRVRPKRGACVQVVLVPMGPGGGGKRGGGKNPLRTVLSIAVVAASFFLGPVLGGAILGPSFMAGPGFLGLTAGAIAGALGGFIITAVGTLALNALIPPPRPSFSQLSTGALERTSPTLALTGTANRASPYGPVICIYGRHRVFPPLAARTITESVGDVQYLRALCDFGYAPIEISDIRIGTVPIGQFEGVETQITNNLPGSPVQTLYPRALREDGYSMRVRAGAGGAAVVETRDDSREALIDIAFLGLVEFSAQGARITRTVRLRFEYQAIGAVSWTAHAERDYSAATEQQIVRGERIVFPIPGRYRIRITRLTPDNTSASIRDDSYLTAVRSVTGEYPVQVKGRFLLAMRIKASEQLSGQLDQVSAIAERYLPRWTGSAWVTEKTRNPAWAYLDVLRGPANRRPIPDSRIDLDAFVDWANACDAAPPVGSAPRWAFDGVFDFSSTVWEALRDIAACGRAAPAMLDGKFSIVRDLPQSVPIQHFTARNSRGFSGRRVFSRRPHAIVARYIEPAREWSQQQVTVYADGYNAANATEIETIERWGVTSREQAWRDTRYDMAVAELRPDTYELTTDIEHLLCTRGDLVRVTHDVPKWGITAGRITAVTMDGGGNVTHLALDEPVPMETGGAYAVRVRRADASSVVASVVTAAGEQTTIQLSPDIPAASAPAAGDLFLFGEADRESVELIVREIQATPDFGAVLKLVDAAPEVHAAESGTIPPFDPQETEAPQVTRPVPGLPLVVGMFSDGRALVLAGDGTVQARIGVMLRGNPPENLPGLGVQIRWRRYASGEPWLLSAPLPVGAGVTLYTEPVTEGALYEVSARAISAAGDAGGWTTPVVHRVVGQSQRPADVTLFTINGRRLDWTPVSDIDLAGYRIRWLRGVLPDWGVGEPAHVGLLTNGPFWLDAAPQGQVVLMIKAVDRGGRESITPALIVTNLGGTPPRFGADEIDFADLDWPGTIAGGTVVSDEIFADEDDPAPMWSQEAGLMFPASLGAMWVAAVWSTLSYEDEVSFSAPPASARIVLQTDMEGLPARLYWRPVDPWLDDDLALMWDDAGALMWSGGGDAWQPWPGALAYPAETTIGIRVEIGGGAVRGVLRQVIAILDVEPLVETLADVALDSGGTRLTLTKPFSAITAVVVTLQGSTSARSVRVVDKDVDLGPMVQALDGSGAGIAASVDATVHGY